MGVVLNVLAELVHSFLQLSTPFRFFAGGNQILYVLHRLQCPDNIAVPQEPLQPFQLRAAATRGSDRKG